MHKVRGSNETEFMVQLGLKVVDSVQVERGGDVMDVDPRGTTRTCKAKVRLPRVSAVGWFLVTNGPLKISFIGRYRNTYSTGKENNIKYANLRS